MVPRSQPMVPIRFTDSGDESDPAPYPNERRREGWTPADAAGLPILPGLARYGEARRGAIPTRCASPSRARSGS